VTVSSAGKTLLQHHSGAGSDQGPLGVRVVAQHAYPARGRGRRPFQQLHGRRPARAIGAEQREDFAAFHVKRDAPNGLEPAPVHTAHVGDLDHVLAVRAYR
jgi:hypothetical protein